ncbi:MAG TPA: ABC transporter ATP-binding protein [Pseudonocardia sp.]
MSPGARGCAARVRGLRKEFRRTVALDSIDLDLPTGAVLGLLGPNGSGKTTLIRLLLGLSRPTAGTVELLGASMPRDARAVLPHVGALVESPGLQPHLTGRSNLFRSAAAEPLLASAGLADAVTGALHRVDLAAAADRPVRHYSPGMRQRLALATVLLAPRRLVVLDEPTNGLDPAGVRLVREVITELRAAGSTVLMSSHLLAEVEQTCSHIAVLAAGSLVAAGELTELLEADGPELVVSSAEPGRALTALRAARMSAYLERGQVVVELPRPVAGAAERVLRTLVHAGVPVAEAHRRRLGLAELFTRLTEETT